MNAETTEQPYNPAYPVWAQIVDFLHTKYADERDHYIEIVELNNGRQWQQSIAVGDIDAAYVTVDALGHMSDLIMKAKLIELAMGRDPIDVDLLKTLASEYANDGDFQSEWSIPA